MNPLELISATAGIDQVDVYSYTAHNFSIAMAVIVALVATGLVFTASRKMHGGVFGSVLGYFGFGMLAVALGYVISSVPSIAAATEWLRLADVAFMVGYILMLLGARRLAKVFGPEPPK